MAEITLNVSEKMNKFILWAESKGEDTIRQIVRERLAMLKEECEKRHGMHDSEGFVWDDVLEQNDGPEQWRHGGDCNLCRRYGYCLKKCRANKLLKQVVTPFLYEMYMLETPDVLVEETANGLTPEMMLKQLGVEDGSLKPNGNDT